MYCIYKLQFRGALNQTFNCVNTKLLRQICTRHIITPLSRVQNDNLLAGINSKILAINIIHTQFAPVHTSPFSFGKAETFVCVFSENPAGKYDQ